MNREFQQYLHRIESQARGQANLTQISTWMEDNYRNPTDESRAWSFKEHEYQIEIVSDPTPDLTMQKCSQVGASELMIRLLGALSSVMSSVNMLYVLPTTRFASRFTTTRLDPMIDTTRVLKSALSKDVDSTDLKRLKNNFIYILGSYGQLSAISVPARVLFLDEVDFCNQTNLKVFNSRLGHQKEGTEIIRRFSTPTVPDYGVNLDYKKSSQKHYAIKCRGCNDWATPNYLDHVEVPGFDGTLREFTRDEISNPLVKVGEAFLRCNLCKSPIPYEDLIDPSKRQWIAKFPDRDRAGYQILPIDVAAINPISRTIMQMEEYENKKDWVNFKVGYPYLDAETSFSEGAIRGFQNGNMVSPPDDDRTDTVANQTFMGVDVGKVSWLSILKPENPEDLDGPAKVIYLERIRQDGDNQLLHRILHLQKVFGVVATVIDAMPDLTVPQSIIARSPHHKAWACYYMRTPKVRKTFDMIALEEEDQIVKCIRTDTFNHLCKRLNTGKTTVANGPDVPTLLEHLKAMKRVDTVDADQGPVQNWINTGDDHYAHSVNYAHIAMKIGKALGEGVITPQIFMPASIQFAKMKSVS